MPAGAAEVEKQKQRPALRPASALYVYRVLYTTLAGTVRPMVRVQGSRWTLAWCFIRRRGPSFAGTGVGVGVCAGAGAGGSHRYWYCYRYPYPHRYLYRYLYRTTYYFRCHEVVCTVRSTLGTPSRTQWLANQNTATTVLSRPGRSGPILDSRVTVVGRY